MIFKKILKRFNVWSRAINFSKEQVYYAAGAFRDMATGIMIAALIPLFVDKKFDGFTLAFGAITSVLLWYIGGILLKEKS